MDTVLAAALFATLAAHAAAFQLVLAAGVPLGHLAMGGRHPGRFPPALRVGAAVQAGLLSVLALGVLSRSGLVLPSWRAASGTLAWAAVVVSALSLLLNLATPSKWERRLWAPVAALMLASSLVVARS